MPGLMRGGWKRGPVSGPPSLQRAAWTAPDHPATAPASYSTARGGATTPAICGRWRAAPAGPTLLGRGRGPWNRWSRCGICASNPPAGEGEAPTAAPGRAGTVRVDYWADLELPAPERPAPGAAAAPAP